MPAITVPKPITNPSPVQVTHSPYDPTGMLFPKSSSIPKGPAPLPVGTITGMFPNPTNNKPVPVPANPLANTASGFYGAPKNLSYYSNLLKSGWQVNPTTGMALSPSEALGKGGGSMQNYLAHKGILDPASAQEAIQQFKQAVASGQLTQNPYAPPGVYQTQAEAAGGPSGGYYSMGIDPGTATNMMRQNWQALNPAANFNPSSTDPQGLLSQFLTNSPGNPNTEGYKSSLGALESGIQNYVKAQEAAKINAAAAAAPPATPQQVYQSKQPGFSGAYFGDPSKITPTANSQQASQDALYKAWQDASAKSYAASSGRSKSPEAAALLAASNKAYQAWQDSLKP